MPKMKTQTVHIQYGDGSWRNIEIKTNLEYSKDQARQAQKARLATRRFFSD